MRDPARIKPFLVELEKLWRQYPDWRFGQLVFNLFPGDPFNIPDDLMLSRIKQGFDAHRI